MNHPGSPIVTPSAPQLQDQDQIKLQSACHSSLRCLQAPPSYLWTHLTNHLPLNLHTPHPHNTKNMSTRHWYIEFILQALQDPEKKIDTNEIRTRAGKPTALAGRLLNHSDIVSWDEKMCLFGPPEMVRFIRCKIEKIESRIFIPHNDCIFELEEDDLYPLDF
ncbi:hypothetical protein MJO28_001887 [Puccinia striiformis f. sp. tritici]|uniref:Uncharacterized protein n=1 Tax=Puccinia striiformis f. sp. tritici TaxID=168172 RepID=A0ACC0EX35_9BASI|nr:hypothetical protein MJO28_001887 [Puccinia striiformis f. sp. tritici]